MAVRNEEMKTFRELSKEERSEIVEAWLEQALEICWHVGWENCIGRLNKDGIYRTKQQKLNIPWDMLRKDIEWVFTSGRNKIWGVTQSCYGTKPELGEESFYTDGGSTWYPLNALNIDTTGVDWKESLAQRPEGE